MQLNERLELSRLFFFFPQKLLPENILSIRFLFRYQCPLQKVGEAGVLMPPASEVFRQSTACNVVVVRDLFVQERQRTPSLNDRLSVWLALNRKVKRTKKRFDQGEHGWVVAGGGCW